ncbi:transmembrane protein 242 isoform X2 [Zootermopsis nevadensis]|uniref:transmembrane protein 242 isoform X2 n=1 Tax=Zootermopsis nevadensis TaxID=136037 RepID=UPI000B8EB605|nr:transmembrane protein 242 isoform X2 [Zootermopsis nevadensis]
MGNVASFIFTNKRNGEYGIMDSYKKVLNIDKIDCQYKDGENDKNFKFKAGIFLASVAGISALVGFGTTIGSVRKKDPAFFNKGITGTREMTETGASLAVRALGWGTLYAVVGCTVFFYSIWKLAGVNDMKEFRMKVGSAMPRIPRNDPPQGRTEFAGLTDLLTYISTDEENSSLF